MLKTIMATLMALGVAAAISASAFAFDSDECGSVHAVTTANARATLPEGLDSFGALEVELNGKSVNFSAYDLNLDNWVGDDCPAVARGMDKTDVEAAISAAAEAEGENAQRIRYWIDRELVRP